MKTINRDEITLEHFEGMDKVRLRYEKLIRSLLERVCAEQPEPVED